MHIVDTSFFRGFVRMASDGWRQGWHERNGGNLSYRLSDDDVREVADDLRPEAWAAIPGNVVVPDLTGVYFMITAAGSFFRNIENAPQECLGIIEINEAGDAYRKCWGFESTGDRPGKPTSELPSHLLIHSVKAKQDPDARVVYHCHPANIAALTFVVPLESDVITKVLWSMISECVMVFPEGVGVLPWMVPGSVELGRASAELMQKFNAIIWPHHGLVCAERTFDLAFGLAHTVEKASEIYIKARSANAGSGDFINCISKANIDELADAYSLKVIWPDESN